MNVDVLVSVIAPVIVDVVGDRPAGVVGTSMHRGFTRARAHGQLAAMSGPVPAGDDDHVDGGVHVHEHDNDHDNGLS